jgi:hypothetical protein
VVRVCERSAALGTGVACSLRDSLANTVVDAQGSNISFICPAIRDGGQGGEEAGGGYALYAAALWPGDEVAPLLSIE